MGKENKFQILYKDSKYAHTLTYKHSGEYTPTYVYMYAKSNEIFTAALNRFCCFFC